MNASPTPLLLLVDGSSYLYRAYHAMPDLRGPRASPPAPCTASWPCCSSCASSHPAEHAACVFDASGPTFRDEWYPEYKAQRAPMPEDLRAQIAPIHEVVRLLGWPVLRCRASRPTTPSAPGPHSPRPAVTAVLISTGDKDLAQLVTEQVTLINTMSNESLDAGRRARQVRRAARSHRRLPDADG
jgi:DNA polymerase-1